MPLAAFASARTVVSVGWLEIEALDLDRAARAAASVVK